MFIHVTGTVQDRRLGAEIDRTDVIWFLACMSKSIRDLSAQQLRRAARLKERIEKLQKELDLILSGAVDDEDLRPKRRMTESGRARIVAAQKRRWAKKKRTK